MGKGGQVKLSLGVGPAYLTPASRKLRAELRKTLNTRVSQDVSLQGGR